MRNAIQCGPKLYGIDSLGVQQREGNILMALSRLTLMPLCYRSIRHSMDVMAQEAKESQPPLAGFDFEWCVEVKTMPSILPQSR